MTGNPTYILRIRFDHLLQQPPAAFLDELRSVLEFLGQTPPFPDQLARLHEECNRLLSEFRDCDARYVARLVELRHRSKIAPAVGSPAPIYPDKNPLEYLRSIQHFDHLVSHPERTLVDPFGTDDDVRADEMGSILHHKVDFYRWYTRDSRGNVAMAEQDQHSELEGFAIELANLRNEIADFHQDFVSKKRTSAGFALLVCEDAVSKIIGRKSVPLSSDPVERKKQIFEQFHAAMVDYLTGNQGARAALYGGRASREDKAALERAVERLRPFVQCVYRELLVLVGPESPVASASMNQNFGSVGVVQIGNDNRAHVVQAEDQSSTKEMKELDSRLHQGEEAFRLLHGPRVSIAVKLWSAYCDFEDKVRIAVSPASVLPAKQQGQTWEEEQKESQRLLAEEWARRARLVGEAWNKLKELRQGAEVILDPQTFAAFESLYRFCERAFTEVWAARQTRDHRELALATSKAMKILDEMGELRAKALIAIQGVIAPERPAA